MLLGDVFNNEEIAHLVMRLLIEDEKKLAQTCRGVMEVKAWSAKCTMNTEISVR